MPDLALLPRLCGPRDGRIRTLDQTARALYVMGLSVAPLPRWQVQEIERRALRKIKQRLRRYDKQK